MMTYTFQDEGTAREFLREVEGLGAEGDVENINGHVIVRVKPHNANIYHINAVAFQYKANGYEKEWLLIINETSQGVWGDIVNVYCCAHYIYDPDRVLQFDTPQEAIEYADEHGYTVSSTVRYMANLVSPFTVTSVDEEEWGMEPLHNMLATIAFSIRLEQVAETASAIAEEWVRLMNSAQGQSSGVASKEFGDYVLRGLSQALEALRVAHTQGERLSALADVAFYYAIVTRLAFSGAAYGSLYNAGKEAGRAISNALETLFQELQVEHVYAFALAKHALRLYMQGVDASAEASLLEGMYERVTSKKADV